MDERKTITSFRDQHSYGTCVECGNRILAEEGGFMVSNDTGAKAHTWCGKGKAEYDDDADAAYEATIGRE